MEVLHPFFLQVDPYPICESLWLALHILDNSVVLELLAKFVSFVRSCCIEKALVVNSKWLTALTAYLFPVQVLLSILSFCFLGR
jgi:hypothetical protein